MIDIDIITYSLCKKFAIKVASGFSSVTVDEATSTINFVLNDGTEVSLKIPKPAGIKDIYFESIIVDTKIETHLMFEMDDDAHTIIDAGKVPTPYIELSRKPGNAIKQEEDGLYVAATGVEIDPDETNVLENREDGLYTPSVKEQEEDVLEIVKNNIEDEPLDFSNFWN